MTIINEDHLDKSNSRIWTNTILASGQIQFPRQSGCSSRTEKCQLHSIHCTRQEVPTTHSLLTSTHCPHSRCPHRQGRTIRPRLVFTMADPESEKPSKATEAAVPEAIPSTDQSLETHPTLATALPPHFPIQHLAIRFLREGLKKKKPLNL